MENKKKNKSTLKKNKPNVETESFNIDYKKILIPTILAVLTLIILVVGATFAYFTITSDNRFGTKQIYTGFEEMADAVLVEQVTNDLSLKVTREQMSEANKGTTYYATGSETPANIAKFSVSGEGSYYCDYTLKVEMDWPDNRLYGQDGQNVYLIINDYSKYYLESFLLETEGIFVEGFPSYYKGRVSGITKDTPQYITANFVIKNSDVENNNLKGKEQTLTFKIETIECDSDEDIIPIYAIYTDDDNALRFYQNNDVINVGEYYETEDESIMVDALFTDLNNTNYVDERNVPWTYLKDKIGYIYIEEKISPQNLSFWFSGIGDLTSGDFTNIDTSKVTSMRNVFAHSGWSDTLNINISNWDLSNVTSMYAMFYNTALGTNTRNSLITWDTSNVEDMSYMFDRVETSRLDLSGWDVSNVTKSTRFTDSSDIIAPSWPA